MPELKLKIIRKLIFIYLFFLVPVFLYAQDYRQWSYNLNIYEVNLRQYTRSGTIAEFETHLDRLKDMGVGILWFMPIHPIGQKNRLGSLGSYYSVKDYFNVNPEFGTFDEFKSLVNKIHQKGMYVIIDWVANHTAWDNLLTITHPDWYAKDNNGNFIPPPGTNWTDVIQLDYNRQALRDYMINAMKFWVNIAGVDGFRCDAAERVPASFWQTAISELKKIKPGIFFLAEADDVLLGNIGFHSSYAWGLHGFGNGILDRIANGTSNANELAGYINSELNNFPADHYRMYFTSNHDENSWFGTVFEEFGNAAEVFAVLTATINGIPLIYSGQEAGLNRRLRFFDKDEITWQQHPFANLYSTVFHLKKENKALWNGSSGGRPIRIHSNNEQAVFAFVREKENDKVFVILNLSNQTQSIIFQDSIIEGNFINVFTSDTVLLNKDEQFVLQPWGYKVFVKNSVVTAVEQNGNSPEDFYLYPNYPNPFNPLTKIKFTIPLRNGNFTSPTNVLLKVFDVLGREISTLVNEKKSAGNYEVTFDASKLSSGVYFYQLRAGSFVNTKKMILMR